MQWWCAAQGVPWTWSWQPYPGVWLFVASLVGVFRLLRGRFPESDRSRFRSWMWGLGVMALWVALDWPVGALGAGYLASVHMVQYLLIALIAPPLLLMGLPRDVYHAIGFSRLAPLLRVLSHPIVAISIFVAVMAWTHWPPVVDTLMVSQLGSFFLDLIWLISGVVFWWPVAAPVPERTWLHEPGKVGYLIVATLVNTGVFAYLTFSPLPLYATYELAPPVTGLSTRDDQLLAGLLMKMGGAVILWTAITVIFFRWVRRSESSVTGAAAGLLLLALLGCGDPAPRDDVDAVSAAPVPALRWHDAGPLQVSGAVVGQPAVPDRAALYMHLGNRRTVPVRLSGIRVEGVGTATFHETRVEDGVMRMRPLEWIDLAPGETVTLRPGGVHVMLDDVGIALRAGDSVTVTLEFTGAGGSPGFQARVVPLDSLEMSLGAPAG